MQTIFTTAVRSQINKSQRRIVKDTLYKLSNNFTDHEINYHMTHGKKKDYSVSDSQIILNYYEKLHKSNIKESLFLEPQFSDYLYDYFIKQLIGFNEIIVVFWFFIILKNVFCDLVLNFAKLK